MEAEESDKSDEELLDELLESRNHAAFSQLVRRHALKFRRVAYRYTSIVEEAEDIVQEAFLALWNNPHLWKAAQGAKFTTWFYRVVVNRCLDYQRKRKTVPIKDDEEFRDESMPIDQMLDEMRKQQQMEQTFRKLPLNMQTALNLSFYDPVPNNEAAKIMGLSLKGFQSLVMRAKTTMKEMIHKEDYKERHYGTQ